MMKKLVILIFCISPFIAFSQTENSGVFGQAIVPGPDAVYIFAVDSARRDTRPDMSVVYTVSKEERRNSGFKKIASLSFPASAAELEKRLDKNVLQELLRKRKFSSVNDLYTQLKAGRFDTLGIYSMSMPVLQALGMLYIDKEASRFKNQAGYKLEVTRNGATRPLYQQNLQDVRYTPFPQFKKYYRSATDSAVIATWYAVGGRATFGQVYFSTDGGRQSSTGEPVYINKRGDTLFASFSMPATPGEKISLYMRPADVAGNMGRPSDTVNLLSLTMNNSFAVSNLAATDTLNGILLKWNPLQHKGYYTGIRVSKSRTANENFVEVEILPATATSYLDKRIISGAQYYYAVEPILYRLPQESRVTPMTVTAVAKIKPRRILAPQNVTPSMAGGQIRLSWLANAELDLFAYYVLRGTSKNNMQVISPAIRDTVYIDSIQNLDANTTYVYAVSVMDMEMKWSDTSELVSVLSPKANIVTPPAGLTGRYTEQGVKLFWNDVAKLDGGVTGYMVYKRKKGEKFFTPVTKSLVPGNYFVDSAIQIAGIYEYGCASVDARSNQSLLSPLAEITVTGTTHLYPPADFNVRNLVGGIEVSIPATVNAIEGKNSYIIYRRVVGDKSAFKKIGEAAMNNSVYVDKQVNKQLLYAYAVSLKTESLESRRSTEKTIRRN